MKMEIEQEPDVNASWVKFENFPKQVNECGQWIIGCTSSVLCLDPQKPVEEGTHGSVHDTERSNIEAVEHVDWRGRKASSKKHGGPRAAALVCVVEVLENLVFLSNAVNFVSYFQHTMHYRTAEAANMVTNFMGTSFLFTLFGGFISDSFLTCFKTFVLFCTVEFVGLVMLTIQAHHPRLQPPKTRTPTGYEATILFMGLYAMAIGVGGVKAALPSHGADQLDPSNQRAISAFFNWFFFSLCTGGIITATVMVWVEENLGWNWSFSISLLALCLALSIFVGGYRVYRYKLPGGSPFSRIFKVLASTFRNWKACPSIATSNSASVVKFNTLGADGKSIHKYKFLNKALLDDKVTEIKVEEARTFIGLLPIFASTIMMNCCLAQLQTFTVQQGFIMNRTVHGSNVPTQSLTVIPLAIMLASIPLYEHLSSTRLSQLSIFRPIKRIGLGLALASGSMAVAALVEAKRRNFATDSRHPTTMSVFWLTWQYLLLGVSDVLTLGGMLEFFYSEAPDGMRSVSTALSWCSTSMGYFMSSVLVSVANAVSGIGGGKEWLGGNDLNHARLDLYYALLCVLNFINLLNYIYWAKRY